MTKYNGQDVTYDLDGNMLTANGMVLTYDSANRLLSAGENTYTYDVENTRVKNLCNGVETEYTYNTNTELSQLLVKTTGSTVAKYVYGNGLIGEETNNTFKTYHFDYRGSTVSITDTTGTVTDTFSYNSYGNVISRTGTTDAIFLYNGEYGVVTDTNGLLYMRARYYSPELRRFINADILMGDINNSTTLNRYAYANGNPISNIDPFGMAADEGRGGQSTTSALSDKVQQLIIEAFGWSVDIFKKLTDDGYLDWFLELTLGATPTDDIYHIRQDWWQSWHFVGYNDFYDWAFDFGTGITGTTMEKDKFDFVYNNKQYIVWVWKGDYVNLGSGAEAGIYEESIIPSHWLTSTDNNLKMSLSLKELDSGEVLFDYHPTENNWWITGFDPSHQNAMASNLQFTITIDFSNNKDMGEAFKKSWGRLWDYNDNKATLVW